jgi:hypothetical protein
MTKLMACLKFDTETVLQIKKTILVVPAIFEKHIKGDHS